MNKNTEKKETQKRLTEKRVREIASEEIEKWARRTAVKVSSRY